jgi:hypothetical protein
MRVGRVGNDNRVVSHKLCGFQGPVGGCVVTKEPIVAAPKFQSPFSSHISSQASQNFTVTVRIDRNVRRNIPLHVEKQQ